MSEKQGLTPYETREILFYKTENGEVRVEILLFQENLWLTQAKMAELFEVQKAAISKHLKNIFESGELSEDSVVSKMETTAADGKLNRPLSSRQVKKEKLRHEGLVPVSKGSQAL